MPKFQPGQSGHPGGRPRSKELRALCREYSEEAVKELARLALHAKGEMVRVIALRDLLDRGFGRPAQSVDIAIEDAKTPEEARPLTPAEVVAGIAKAFSDAEIEMGIPSGDGLSDKQRMQQILRTGEPLSPVLYKIWREQYSGTKH